MLSIAEMQENLAGLTPQGHVLGHVLEHLVLGTHHLSGDRPRQFRPVAFLAGMWRVFRPPAWVAEQCRDEFFDRADMRFCRVNAAYAGHLLLIGLLSFLAVSPGRSALHGPDHRHPFVVFTR